MMNGPHAPDRAGSRALVWRRTLTSLEVRHLRLVAEIGALGSVTRAAERLHLTQSALSHQLREIESRVGTAFFLRLGKRMVLTPAGERVLRSAHTVLENLAAAEEDLRRFAGQHKGVVRICTQCNTGYYWLPPLLRAFNVKYPDVDVQIVVDATTRPIEALLAGRLDLAVITSACEDPRVLVRPMFEDEFVLVTSPAHRFADRKWVMPSELAAEHLIIYSMSRDDSFTFQGILNPAGVVPERVSHVQLTEAIIEMVKADLGVSLLARWAVEPAIAAGAVRAVRLTRDGLFRQWSAATLRAQPEPAYRTEFLALVVKHALPAQASERKGRPALRAVAGGRPVRSRRRDLRQRSADATGASDAAGGVGGGEDD